MRITYDGGHAERERAPRRICSLVGNEVIRGQGLRIKKKDRKVGRGKKTWQISYSIMRGSLDRRT